MEDDEYELVSSEEVDRLKREIEHLKSNPFVQNSSDMRLYEAVNRLNDSVTKLYMLFENVNKQLMSEYQTGETPEAKLDKLLEQNRNIAEALVTFVSKNDQPESQMQQTPQSAEPTFQPISFPAVQQPLQMQGQIPPNPFVESSPKIAPQTQAQANSFVQNQANNPYMQNNQFQQMNNQFPQNQAPLQQQHFGFAGRVDPNFPTPDNFPSLGTPPSMGEPINLEVKKKGFLGLGKK